MLDRTTTREWGPDTLIQLGRIDGWNQLSSRSLRRSIARSGQPHQKNQPDDLIRCASTVGFIPSACLISQ
jgi:hypothetical protein